MSWKRKVWNQSLGCSAAARTVAFTLLCATYNIHLNIQQRGPIPLVLPKLERFSSVPAHSWMLLQEIDGCSRPQEGTFCPPIFFLFFSCIYQQKKCISPQFYMAISWHPASGLQSRCAEHMGPTGATKPWKVATIPVDFISTWNTEFLSSE